MDILIWKTASTQQKIRTLSRPAQSEDAALLASVAAILRDVQKRGDAALRDYSRKFDHASRKDFRVSSADMKQAASFIDPKLAAAMKRAKSNIAKFHQAELPKAVQVQTMPGVSCALRWLPIEKIGLYIPAGTAPLFSALLMQAIPAHIAGCHNIVLCSPPQRDGKIHPAVLAAAYLCGIRDIFAVGGAQAIAAMAYGTQTIPKADKIFGPGNAYVTAAKQLVSQDPHGAAIDMPAGPSEVMVIAEKSANPAWAAADMLAQAEHDTADQAILVTTDAAFAQKVKTEVERQLATLSRKAIATQSIAQSRIIVASNMREAIDISNLYAPEHLIIHSESAAKYLPAIRHAGSVFLGAHTPESAGDYASGTNHVLPTYGYARAYSGLTVQSFMKSMSVQSLTLQGLRKLGPTIVAMAEAEGLDAHANAVKVRLQKKSARKAKS